MLPLMLVVVLLLMLLLLLLLSESNEIVDEDGISLPSRSLPTDVARSSGSGCSSVKLL